MVAFFQSLEKTLAAGVALLIAIVVIVGLVGGQWIRPDFAWWTFLMRWLHVASAVMWVGLLIYLNFVQTPTLPKIEPMEHRAAVMRFIMPNVLFWFRYSALATVVTGLLLAGMIGYLVEALTLRPGVHTIGIGMWLALIMAFNVWFIIWPNQRKVLGLAQASAEQKAAAGRIAGTTSRINMMLAVPMLYCMVGQQNAGL